ncbi:MAG: D-alanyl-D-alanine carboxypeptidase family protein [Sandaracinaceae bacterium]|nr:D-alanyl-D-alanine carboxypeptidase family protein [Sandaracinaceae bacterium]
MPEPRPAPLLRSLFVVCGLLALSAPASAQTVGDRWGTIGTCSTGTIRSWPINDQIARAHRCLGGVEIVPIVARRNLRLLRGTEWGHARTRDAVYRAAESQSLQINTAYRTVLEQHGLDQTCTSAAAAPGHSNHETGTALDIQQAGSARAALEGAGCDWPAIPGDLVHYNCPPFGTRITSVIAFQRLWNLNHPSDRIAEDNSFGPITRGKLMASPIAGFANDGCGCDDTAGPFTFSCDGEETGATCVSLDEPADPDGWDDNFLCSETDLGFRWSTDGPIDGMRCVNVTESADAHAADWADDYACLPEDSPYELAWSGHDPIAGWDCVRWNETDDPGTWNDNYLCSRRVHCFSAGGLTFCGNGPPDDEALTCVSLESAEDPDTWHDNVLCAAMDLGIVWSTEGPVDGMRCTLVDEPGEPAEQSWDDNYLCLPDDSPYELTWSSEGAIDGVACVRFYESADLDEGWGDNYLCIGAAPEEMPDAGPPLLDGGVTGFDAALASTDAGDSTGSLSGSCACRASGPGGSDRAPPPWLAALLGLAVVWRRGRR